MDWIREVLFVALLLGCVIGDLRSRSIPDVLTIGGSLALVALAFLHSPLDGAGSVAAGCIGFAVFLAVRFASRGKLGGGDVKMSMLIGAALGVVGWYVAVCVAVAMAIAYAAATRRERRAILFAPFLSFGGTIGLLVATVHPL